MKLLLGLIVLYASINVQASQVECYANGVLLPIPPSAQWIPVPNGYNTAPCNKFYNKKGFGCWPGQGKPPKPDPCPDKYASGCPLACDGPTPGDKCKRQRDSFTSCDNDDGLVIGPGGC